MQRMSHLLRMAVFAIMFLGVVSPGMAAEVLPVEITDTFTSRQWYLDTIHVREAWTMATGSRNVVVAVIDSGVDISHPDLASRIWQNPDEVPNNGKDDDGDGFIDDVSGWNFVNHSADVGPVAAQDGLADAWIHGTVVASIIAAGGNDNIGISGIAWQTRIMPIVALGSSGVGRDEDIVRAIRYAVLHGADIINLSLVGYEFDPDLDDAIRVATAQGVLVVSAAGNSDEISGQDLDTTPGFPACDHGVLGLGALTVTSLNRQNLKSRYANYGSCVDVSAPGENIFAARPTTDPTPTSREVPGYVGGLSGTSLAAPMVSGVAALLKGAHPEWRGPQLAERIRATVDPLPDVQPEFRGKLGRGRVNAYRALKDDVGSRRLGPLSLEASDGGRSPEIRVLDSRGEELFHFGIGTGADRRAVRATFIRWQGNLDPDIAITMVGDPTGAWRVYRLDGVLLAAGTLGTPIAQGAYLAASDVYASGRDVLFIGEAKGSHAWLVDSTDAQPHEIKLFDGSNMRGISALTVTRPALSFFVNAKFGDPQLVVIGKNGDRLAQATFQNPKTAQGRTIRRSEKRTGGSVFTLEVKDQRFLFQSDSTGIRPTIKTGETSSSMQIPEGERRHQKWLYYETWPR